jgi:hypothetical protein
MSFSVEITLVYLLLLVLVSIYGATTWRKTDRATRIFIAYTSYTTINEVSAFIVGHYQGNNLLLYSAYGFGEILFIGWYYNQLIVPLKKNNKGIMAGFAGVCIGVVNLYWFQAPETLNSNFLFIEGIAIIVAALYYCLQWVMEYEGGKAKNVQHFWFSVILASYWSITFFSYGLYTYLAEELSDKIGIYHNCLVLLNIITYLFIGYVFYLASKVKTVHD